MNYFMILTRNLYKFYTNVRTNIKAFNAPQVDQFYYGFGWVKRR